MLTNEQIKKLKELGFKETCVAGQYTSQDRCVHVYVSGTLTIDVQAYVDLPETCKHFAENIAKATELALKVYDIIFKI